MFESLKTQINKSIKVLQGKHKITDINISTTIKDIRKALISADVNYKIAKEVTQNIKEKALGTKVLTSVSPGEQLIKIVNDELINLMQERTGELKLKDRPNIILLVGLQGAGKTTLAAKLANFLKNQHKTALLIAADVYRPAAIEQLITLGKKIEVEVYHEENNKQVMDIIQRGIQYANQKQVNTIIIDTAGRLAIDQEMIQEIIDVKQAVQPTRTLFVVDSMIGQDAIQTAKTFDEKINYDGIILTKLDGDTRGGVALSITKVVQKPIYLISTGEKIDQLMPFSAEKMAKRILGMDDVVSLVKRLQDLHTKEEEEKFKAKLKANRLDLDDLLNQIEKINKIGGIKSLMDYLPKMGGINTTNMNFDKNLLKNVKSIIQSMKPNERKYPNKIESKRKNKIAQGSGTTIQDVNLLIKQFQNISKNIKKFQSLIKF